MGRYSPILQCHNLTTCTNYEITNIYIQIACQFTFTVLANQMHPFNAQKKCIYHNMAIQETSQRMWWGHNKAKFYYLSNIQNIQQCHAVLKRIKQLVHLFPNNNSDIHQKKKTVWAAYTVLSTFIPIHDTGLILQSYVV